MDTKKISINDLKLVVDNWTSKNEEWLSRDVDFIVGISRGGLTPAILIATKLNKPLVAAYIDKKDNVYFDRGEWIKDKNVLLVDDICRTGKTLNKIADLISESKPKTLKKFVIASIIKDGSILSTGEEVDLLLPWDYDRK